MTSARSFFVGLATTCLGLVTVIAAQQPSPKSPSAAAAKPATVAAKPAVSHPQVPASTATASADYNGLVKKYCAGCHNDRNKDRAGSLTLASFDIAKAGKEADVAERMILSLIHI